MTSTMTCPTEDCLFQMENKVDCIEYLCPDKCNFRSCPTRIREDNNCFVIMNCSPKAPSTVGSDGVFFALVAIAVLVIFLIGLYVGKKTNSPSTRVLVSRTWLLHNKF